MTIRLLLAMGAATALASVAIGATFPKPFSGPTGAANLPMFLGDITALSKPEPVAVKVVYDPQRQKFCVTKAGNTAHRVERTVCRTAAAWNKSGELQNRVG
jgi:hypothetical protein